MGEYILLIKYRNTFLILAVKPHSVLLYNYLKNINNKMVLIFRKMFLSVILVCCNTERQLENPIKYRLNKMREKC